MIGVPDYFVDVSRCSIDTYSHIHLLLFNLTPTMPSTCPIMNSPRNKVYYYGNKHEKYILRKYFPLINHQILPWIFDVVMHISPGGLFLFILNLISLTLSRLFYLTLTNVIILCKTYSNTWSWVISYFKLNINRLMLSVQKLLFRIITASYLTCTT